MTPPSFPQAAGKYFFPPTRLLHQDWINIALCASRRASENVLDEQRWNREYYGYMSILKGKVAR